MIRIASLPSLRDCDHPAAAELLALGAPDAAEGYRLRVDAGGVTIVGRDARGVLFGIGHLLRELRMRRTRLLLPTDLDISTAPAYPLRGHQLGYRDKTNSYDGWDLPQWEQYICDMAVFGANAIEMIPPRSDDLPDSVHFPRPILEMMAGVSAIADEYGIDVWLWYPAGPRSSRRCRVSTPSWCPAAIPATRRPAC
ncbi:MAG: glycoside hydrolase family 20 zincin-like fold domain-containing protein [Anaerolineae bacterium]|nr:glycoside hydrolase family 20 zincin-like fold domain-containing protein [Anaerolineae bacterium]